MTSDDHLYFALAILKQRYPDSRPMPPDTITARPAPDTDHEILAQALIHTLAATQKILHWVIALSED